MGCVLNRAAKKFGGVASRVEAECNQSAPPGTGKDWPPQKTITHKFKLGKTVVDEIGLYQQRRTSKKIGERPYGSIEPAQAVGPGDCQRYRHYTANQQGQNCDLKRE